MYDVQKNSRRSPGFFSLFNLFTNKIVITALMIIFPLLIGLIATLFNFIFKIPRLFDFIYFSHITAIFYIILIAGVLSCITFRNSVPILNYKISILINIYGITFFAASYFFGQFLELYLDNITFIEMFFILGGLLSYIVQFVIYFSFTTIKTPLNIFLALIQPVFGIFFYSVFTESITIAFYLRAMVFFCSAAVIFVIPYSAGMFSVSKIYRSKTGIGGYNFVRAFVTSLLVDDQDDLVESYFEEIGVKTSLKILYTAFRSKKTKKLKGLFIVPDVHFGPFKTSGSAALTEEIYNKFNNYGGSLTGLTVFHTTSTHGENLTSHKYNSSILQIIDDDINELKFSEVKIPEFHRCISGKAKILGTSFNNGTIENNSIRNNPFLIISRHPFPSDDMMPEIGEKISKSSKEYGLLGDASIIDAHNAIIGDEVLIKVDSPECKEINEVSKIFLKNISDSIQNNEIYDFKYGTAFDPMDEFNVSSGIGAGGIRLHLFKINKQTTAIIHFDGNNALMDVRSRLINLGENKGIDRVEVTTSDSHTVARILSSQGYYPIGAKIPISTILKKVDLLLDTAKSNLEPVEVAIHKSITPGFTKWGDLSYFDVVIETIEQALHKSKQLLTISLLIPFFISILLATFYFNIPFPSI